MQTAIEVLKAIDSHAQSNQEQGLTYDVPVDATEGRPIPQGDINIWVLDKLPEDIKPVSISPQLAPGSTRGSRHCISQDTLCNIVQQYTLFSPNALQGPIFELSGPIEIEHPEHDNQIWSHARYIAITYQRRYAEDLRRIAD